MLSTTVAALARQNQEDAAPQPLQGWRGPAPLAARTAHSAHPPATIRGGKTVPSGPRWRTRMTRQTSDRLARGYMSRAAPRRRQAGVQVNFCQRLAYRLG